MLGANELPLRQGFRLAAKTLVRRIRGGSLTLAGYPGIYSVLQSHQDPIEPQGFEGFFVCFSSAFRPSGSPIIWGNFRCFSVSWCITRVRTPPVPQKTSFTSPAWLVKIWRLKSPETT